MGLYAQSPHLLSSHLAVCLCCLRVESSAVVAIHRWDTTASSCSIELHEGSGCKWNEKTIKQNTEIRVQIRCLVLHIINNWSKIFKHWQLWLKFQKHQNSECGYVSLLFVLFISSFNIHVQTHPYSNPRKKYTSGPRYWNVPVLVNTGTFWVFQYCLKMWYLRSLEHAGVIQKLPILEHKNGLVLSNTCVPVSGTSSILFPNPLLTPNVFDEQGLS